MYFLSGVDGHKFGHSTAHACMADLLVFHLGGQRYALATTAVQEVVCAVAVVPLPKAPSIVEGVIDYRGQIVPGLDIRERFGLPSALLDVHNHFIVAQAHRVVALRVDRVAQVLPIGANDAEAIESGTPYITGAVRLADGLVLIHDLATFLSAAEQTSIDEALTS